MSMSGWRQHEWDDLTKSLPVGLTCREGRNGVESECSVCCSRCGCGCDNGDSSGPGGRGCCYTLAVYPSPERCPHDCVDDHRHTRPPHRDDE